MTGPKPLEAEVVTETGEHFFAQVTNLASTGLFLHTGEPLRFRQRLTLRLLGVTARGEVLFVSVDPFGAVVGLRASGAALATLEAHQDNVPSVAGALATEDPWAEETRNTLPPDHPLISDVVTQLVDEVPPEALAAADSGGADEVEPAPTPSPGPRSNLTVVRSDHENEHDEHEHGDDDESEPSTLPPDLLDAPAVGVDPFLPKLEADGFTIRFASADAYRNQFASHINHGGLVVQAAALPIGTQRMLSLVVPSVGTYTVSARVIFHTTGKLGFMLDSFGVHRARLAAMAKAS